MEYIFHEKQDGSLCAQHCLNNLLQGQYFSPVDLATLALKMDEEERKRMAELGDDTEDYQKFLAQPSGNCDDSGYFSVQVISAALAVWELELIPYKSTAPVAALAQDSPQDMSAFICNYRDHWLTIRKIGHQWFNLNSLLSGPELISPTYLSIFLAQLQQEGYSIFVVIGELPACEANEILNRNPAVQVVKPKLNNVSNEDSELQKALRISAGNYEADEEEELLQQAIQKSLEDEPPDKVLQNAIKQSLDASKPSTSSFAGTSMFKEQFKLQSSSQNHTQDIHQLPDSKSEEDLFNAIQMSLEEFEKPGERAEKVFVNTRRAPPANTRTAPPANTRTAPPAPTQVPEETDVEEVRRRRLAYLERKAKDQR
ncbi:ataxin-3-like isoform X1 [Cimex lectularius]|uniref:ubiquitinyl hydrolase 1 n=1 Tax=Cimex lectularius TaxID=79782 RepID=A0A8I6S5I6_CIMLE|nr:ataxin-3-like isoform X1 [Cimex lectularius]